MSEANGNGHLNPAFLDKSARAITLNKIRTSVRQTLRQSLDLKDLAYAIAMSMRDAFGSEEEADRARSQAQAVTSCIKAFGECATISRIERGKPLPGSRRPLPEQPKTRKNKPANKPPSFKPRAEQVQVQPACGQEAPSPSVPSLVPGLETTQEPAKP